MEDVLRGSCGRLLGESERADVEFDQNGESALGVAWRAERVRLQHFVGIVAVGSVVESLRLPAAWSRSRSRSRSRSVDMRGSGGVLNHQEMAPPECTDGGGLSNKCYR